MPNRSRISPRCAGRSTVRTRCCNPISANWPLSPTWRIARRTTIAPRANSITASIATSRWTGGFFGPRAVIRRPRRAAPPPERHDRIGVGQHHPVGARPPRDAGRRGRVRHLDLERPHPTPPPRVARAPRLRAGRWCCTTRAFKATTPRTRARATRIAENNQKAGWDPRRARRRRGGAEAGRARRGCARGTARHRGGAGERRELAAGRAADGPAALTPPPPRARRRASLALRARGLRGHLVLGGPQRLLREHRGAARRSRKHRLTMRSSREW